MKHPPPIKLSELLDRGLPRWEAEELNEHLAGCPECSQLLEELREVQARARALPDLEPAEDLWPGIARALREGGEGERDVIRLHPTPPIERPGDAGRLLRLSIPQAVAAGLALTLISGSFGAALGHRSAGEPATVAATVETPEAGEMRELTPEALGLAAEVAQLENIVAENRDGLGPSSARILDKNLDAMNRAIQESLSALRGDPGNAFLESHLTRSYRAKAEYLRETTALLSPDA